jgi:uncharacterized protein (DUF2384 family)
MTADEAAMVIRELHDFYSAFESLEFLQSPHKLLDGRKPIDCPLADVLRLIDQLKSGAFT